MEKIKYHKNYESLFDKFIKHSHDVAGLAEGTIYIRSNHTRLFFKWLSGKKIINIEDVLPQHVIAYLKAVSSKYSSTTLGCVSSVLRSFFLYLRMRGIGHEKLADSVPRMKIIRLKNVPSYLNEVQEEKFLASFDRTKNSGKRNYAIAILLIKLGLRANEALSLTLDDIKWKNGIIIIKNKKCRREDQLPLLPVVGEALTDYVLNARPKSSCRQLFLRLKFGKTLPIKRGTIGSAMHSGLARFGITLPNHAAHVMRRSLASRMIQRGSSIKEIADVLRQRDLNTTMLYTKVNLPLLREVAMPWPTSLIGRRS